MLTIIFSYDYLDRIAQSVEHLTQDLAIHRGRHRMCWFETLPNPSLTLVPGTSAIIII